MQDCNDALVKIRLAFRHVQAELPAEGATAAAAAVTLPEHDDDGFGDIEDHEVELLLLGGGGYGYGGGGAVSTTTSAALGGLRPASSEGFDMIEVDVLGLGSQGTWA